MSPLKLPIVRPRLILAKDEGSVTVSIYLRTYLDVNFFFFKWEFYEVDFCNSYRENIIMFAV